MMKAAILIALLVSPNLALAVDPVSVKVHSVKPGRPYAEVLYEVENSSSRAYEAIQVSCGVFDEGGGLVGASKQYVQNIKPGEKDYSRLLVDVDSDAAPKSARCRVVDLR